MLFHGVCETVTTLAVLVQFDPLVKSPIIGKTRDSCMLKKGCPLLVVGVEFIPVGFVDQHKSQRIVLTGRYKDIQFSHCYLRPIIALCEIIEYPQTSLRILRIDLSLSAKILVS